MSKFIEIHAYGTKLLLNLDACAEIMQRSDGGAFIYFYNGNTISEPEESYDQILKMIGTVQGGIPINTWSR